MTDHRSLSSVITEKQKYEEDLCNIVHRAAMYVNIHKNLAQNIDQGKKFLSRSNKEFSSNKRKIVNFSKNGKIS